MLLIIPSIIVLVGYVALIAFFARGWTKIPCEIEGEEISVLPKISVLAVCKNETENLSKLLESLKNQTVKDFELILINDGSTDKTSDVINKFSPDFQTKIINNIESKGKKAALRQGVLEAENELVVTADADCVLPQKWLETICRFHAKNNCDLIILPVAIEETDAFISKIQNLEFVSLVASGAGAAGAGSPVLCNGANLAFKRSIWLENHENIHAEQVSGDDVFLLESVKKKGGKIRFLKSKNVLAKTEGAKNLQHFFRQRHRWASKSSSYSDKLLIFTALTVFLISFTEIFLLVIGIFSPKFWIMLAIIFGCKFFTDLIFMSLVNKFFQLKNLIINSFLLSVVYPFYVCTTAFSAIFFQPSKWK
jgi:cellulose synthase/poly-beta-1,6-N-acetylglucosamine synthase-like glycosyltransferase